MQTAPTDQDYLYLGISGHVVCIRKSDGEELWRTLLYTLRKSFFTKKSKRSYNLHAHVNVVVEPDGIYAYTLGTLYALEPNTGAISWCNELPEIKDSDFCTIGSANQTPVAIAAIKAAQAQAAAVAAAQHHD